jgi:hypothetical protein
MTLEERFLKSLLRPGDILLYDKNTLFNWLIKLKRGEHYAHVEVFKGGDRSLASRNGIGVNEYPLRFDGLAAIYRVTEPFEFEMGYRWFLDEAKGQGYDWLGLASFIWAKWQGRENGKMFCSEFVVRFFRKMGVALFSAETDADAVSPGMIPYSQSVKNIWKRKDKKK